MVVASGCAELSIGDEPSVKIESLEAAKIMKIKWLVLGCIEADFARKYSTESILEDVQDLHPLAPL